MASDRSHDPQRGDVARARRADTEAHESAEQEAHPLLKLQRQVGNAQVARMLAQRKAATIQRTAEGEQGPVYDYPWDDPAYEAPPTVVDFRPESEVPADLQKAGGALVQTGGELMRSNPGAGTPAMNAGQALLMAGVNMKHESSLDPRQIRRSVADVQREAEGAEEEDEGESVQLKRDDVQRAAEEEEDEGEEVQLKRATPEVGLEGGPISDGLAGQIRSQRGAGSSLDEGTRVQMEGSFGTSFEDVRVHTGAQSSALNRSLSAKAFTTGADIFFGDNASPGDRNLLAHELTHVVQQRGMSGGGPMTVGPAGDSYEREAESAASALSTPAPAAAQRQVDSEQEA